MKPFFTALELCEAVMFLDETKPKEFYVSLASYCNAKLEREGKRVYGRKAGCADYWSWTFDKDESLDHTALLIQIEEIEK
jgi:uncharacterized protein (DUF427 family)